MYIDLSISFKYVHDSLWMFNSVTITYQLNTIIVTNKLIEKYVLLSCEKDKKKTYFFQKSTIKTLHFSLERIIYSLNQPK